MKKVTLFVLRGCPHCRKALREMEELFAQHPEYKSMELEIVDEIEQRARANAHDYYYVPTFYVGEEKIYEGAIREDTVETVFRRAME